MEQYTKEERTRRYKMKTKVTNLLIKWGKNSNEVAKMVAENFDYAIRVYPEATARELAQVISAIY